MSFTRPFFWFSLLAALGCAAQSEHIQYRSSTNELYWKNRLPHAGYWQQDVHYNIKASINDSTDILTGSQELTYWNNAPFDIPFVYFHLYSNAQTKDSYLADLYKNNNYHLKFGKYRSQNLGITVNEISAEGKPLKTELDNTILKVWLPRPLRQGESITFNISFSTYFDKEAIRNRMKMFNSSGKKHYDVVHWYPRIAVIDRKFIWTTDQHMDHEFYGDFGSYNVEMTLPSEYICDGTGILLNEKEVLPDSLRRQLDLSNFLNKPFNSPPSTIIQKDGSTKTWKFSAMNVHDFAFTADPNYRIGEARWNGIRCIALVQESHAAGWYNAPSYIAKILEVNSYNIGPYHYPKIIVADAQDGMEYPMLTLCGGFDPDYRTLLIHEITHNWFQGMVGNNETYRAWLDEGLTQFYTADSYQFIDGPISVEAQPKSKYVRRFTKPQRIVDDQIYNSYYAAVVTRQEEAVLNTHADDFNGGIRHGGGYSQSYTKTAAMLKNLEYVLGRALFDKSMQHFFNQWKFCHPYPEDFRNSIIQYTGVDLNWFFDQWLETSKTIDYKIGKIKKQKKGVYEITFKRKGGMQMPVDFVVIDGNDSARHYHIPNSWYVKPTSATVLPRWIGWGPKLKTSYTATINLNSHLKNVVIDPSYRLADVDMTNNMKRNRVNLTFDSKIYNPSDWKNYEMRIRPSVWYNGYDGLKFGIALSGDYMKKKHAFELLSWMSSGIGQAYIDTVGRTTGFQQLSVMLDYRTSLNRWLKGSSLYAQLRTVEGLDLGLLGIENKTTNGKTRLYTHVKAMLRDLQKDLVYLIHPHEWGLQKLNSTLHAGVEHNYKYKRGTGNIHINLRAPVFTNDYDFSAASINVVNRNALGLVSINTRVFGQLGYGNRLPSESMLFVAGANNEELMENKYTRSMGFFPPSWGGYGAITNHFSAGGGLNLRGYTGYLMPEIDADGNMTYHYKGTTGAAFNAELEFGKLFSFIRDPFRKSLRIVPYLFGDAGTININAPGKPTVMSNVIADAGAGISLSILRWWKLYNIKPLTVRFDVPFFLNRLPYAEKDYIQFRWVLGINRAF